MSGSERQGWFYGDTLWYHRALILFIQLSIVNIIGWNVFGFYGGMTSGLVTLLLLFRHIDAHIAEQLE